LAAAIHWHESTVRRRIDELRRSGLLVFELDIDNRVLGLNEHALLWLSVEPARLEEAGNALAAHPEIPFAAATTGPTNLVASAVFRDTRRSEEHTSELQSHLNLVCRLLLEKKTTMPPRVAPQRAARAKTPSARCPGSPRIGF